MHQVEVTQTVQSSYEEIMENLSPESIVDYTEIYDIVSVDEVNGKINVVVEFREEEMTLEFSKTKHGYEYRLIEGSGLFKERYTKITIHDGRTTRISAKARYTLDTFWSFLLDRFAAGTVKEELDMVIQNIEDDISQSE